MAAVHPSVEIPEPSFSERMPRASRSSFLFPRMIATKAPKKFCVNVLVHTCNGRCFHEDYPMSAGVSCKSDWVRRALASDSPLCIQEKALWGLWGECIEGGGTIFDIETEYGQEAFYRAVYESSEKVYGENDRLGQDLVLRWLLPVCHRIAIQIYKALRENSLKDATEIICSLAKWMILQVKESYASLFGVELEVDIENFTAGNHRKLLHGYIRAASTPEGNTDLVAEQFGGRLSSLYQNITLAFKHPQIAIKDIILGLSEEHRSVLPGAYTEKFGRSLEEDLKLAGSGHFEYGLRTILKCAENRPKFWAEIIYEAMKDSTGQGIRDISQIDHTKIVRVLTTVSERDMMMIKKEYHEDYGRTLEGDVCHAFSYCQEYVELILPLLNPSAAN